MTSLQVAEKKEKSLTEVLLVITLVGLLMTAFIYYFFKHQGQLTQTGFQSLANVFSARVNGFHAQWFMEKQPKFIFVNSYNSQGNDENKMPIPMNDNGWIDTHEPALYCQKIWQFVIEAPLIYMNEPISAVLIEDKSDNVSHYCRYGLRTGEFFTYHSFTGKVSRVQIPNE